MERRYGRFYKVQFPGVDKGEWPALMRDLLEYEDGLAAGQYDVGLVRDRVFELRLDPTTVPHRAKVKRYDSGARKWMRKHIDKLVRTGVLEEASIWAPRTSNVVLVPEG